MADKPAPLNSLIARRGAAVPSDPETAALVEHSRQEQGQGELVPEARAVVTAIASGVSDFDLERYGISTAPKPKVVRVALNLKVPEDLAQGIKRLSQETGVSAQDILARWMLRGLNTDDPNWHSKLRR